MINFGFKTKAGTKPKKARETSIKACCCSGGKDALTPEDIAEINMLSKAIAKMNVARR